MERIEVAANGELQETEKQIETTATFIDDFISISHIEIGISIYRRIQDGDYVDKMAGTWSSQLRLCK